MKKKMKGVYFLLSTLLIALLQLPFAFAKSSSGIRLTPKPSSDSNTVEAASSDNRSNMRKSVYDSLHLDMKGLSREAFVYAETGFEMLGENDKLSNNDILTVIDFSLPSNKKRMFIIDMKNYRVLFHTLVSHGMNTGHVMATSFSNAPQTHKSSPGFYITRETYQGGNGYSLKLEGLERGINDNAYRRGIVIHGAAYVNEAVANSGGFVGRSHGCPAVPKQLTTPIINTIKNGTCLFIYHPSYVERSALLN
jgi:hypothetical protein